MIHPGFLIKKCLYSILFTSIILLPASRLNAQLRINEVSQGPSGTKEYAELVVVGTRTCSDSCADIRNWIIDDNNGWLGAGTGQGIATGCMRFANDPNWSCVPYGSIIVVYDDGDPNPSITQAVDPTDANHDHVYIVPASSTYMERNSSTPISPSIPNYVYPTTGFNPGGSWNSLGLSNNGDAIIITSPVNLAAAYHSLGFGNLTNPAAASIFFPTAGSAKVYYLTDGQYNNVGSWTMGNAPANETPGVPNTAANATWINSMLAPIAGNITTDIYACVTNGHFYFFNNQNLSVAGIYNDTLVTASGCDSIVKLHLNVVTPTAHDSTINSCATVIYNGNPYASTTNVLDTLHSYQGCDSIYRTTHIIIQNSVVTNNDTLSGCGQVVYNATTYSSSTIVGDTLQSVSGCDSVFNNMYIIVYPVQPVTVNDTLSACSSVVFNNNTYTSSTVVVDTLYSVHGCDSAHRNTAIIILAINPVSMDDTITGCRGLVVNNQPYYSSAIVSDTLFTQNGCDSVYRNLFVNILIADSVYITPADTAICPGKSVQLKAGGTNQIDWMGFTAPDSITVKPDSTTGYYAVGTSANGCTDTAEAIVTVEKLVLSLTASPDTLVLTEDVFSLVTSGNFPYDVNLWYPYAFFPHQHSYSQQLVADETRKYTVIGQTKLAGCKDTAVITVRVNEDPYQLMPNAFTPNGDGLNDFIFPRSNKPFTISRFVIFNKWGNEVYDYATGDKRGWDGNYKGVAAAQAVYAYYIAVTFANGKALDKKGNITLLRSHP